MRIKFEKSIMDKAIKDDEEAIRLMYSQFLSEGESIQRVDFLGTRGLFPFRSYSFACLTNLRVASLEVGPFRKIEYEDVWHESVNGAEVKQPSKAGLYFGLILLSILFFIVFRSSEIRYVLLDLLDELAYNFSWDEFPFDNFFVITIELLLYFLLFNSFIRTFHRINKSGLLFKIREKSAVYVFCDRERMLKINQFYRDWSNRRKNIKKIG